MTENDLLTSGEAGVLLGKSARTVQRMVEAGSLTPVRRLPGVNGAYLFNRTDIKSLLAETAQ